MYLKVMHFDDLPDNHWAKGYTLYDCKFVSFIRHENGNAMAQIDGELISLGGNAYIMNNAGKTIDSFACIPYPVPEDNTKTLPVI